MGHRGLRSRSAWRTAPAALALAAIATSLAAGLLVAGCGDDDDDGGDQALVGAPTATDDLDRFLLRANEAPGYSPAGKPETLSTARAFVEDIGGTKAEEQRLRDLGFEAFVVQMLDGPSGTVGLTNVSLFSAEDGAARELEHLLSTIEQDVEAAGAKVDRFFDVPGVPTAAGYTVDKPGRHKAADVRWSQGRCVMTLGSEPPYVDRLRAGVRAIYERTNGQCP
jgi:hypothetical protein